MLVTIHKIKNQDVLFFIAYGLFLIFGILSTTFYYKYFIGIPYSLIKYISIILLILRELMNHKYTIRSFSLGLLFLLLVFITRSQSTFSAVTFVLIFVFCARNIKFDEIARFSIWITSLLLIFIILSAYIGFIDNYVSISPTRIRYYLGFRYSLFAPAFLFNITGLYLYLKKDHVKWIELIILLILNLWMFLQTDARLSFYLSCIMIIIFGLLKIFPNIFDHSHFLCWLMIFSFVILFVMCLYFTASYNNTVSWQNQLNSFLGNRLSLGKASLMESGVSLFGQRLELVGNGLDAYGNKNTNPYNYVDSFFIQVLQRYGIIFSIVWISILTFAMYRCYKMKDYYMLVCLSIIALHCSIDDLSLYLYYNTFWFYGSVIMSNFSGKRKLRNFQKEEMNKQNLIDINHFG